MKISLKAVRKGFTLLEMTVAILVGLVIAGLLMAMLNQQIAFLRIFRAQSFLHEEAPIISNHVSKILSRADRFVMYDTLANAVSGTGARLPDSDNAAPVLVLKFDQPDNTEREGILSFEDLGDGPVLNYYAPTMGTAAAPEWSVTTEAADVEFFMDSGILVTRLTGPAGEEISFTGAME